MKPEFFFFDLGNVLLEFDNERMFRQLAGESGSPAAIRNVLLPAGDETDLLWRFECGRVDAAEVRAAVERARPAGASPWSDADFAQRMSDIFTPIEATMRLVERLAAAGHQLGLLSNTNPVHWEFFMDGRYPTLNKVFDPALGSFHLKAMKPEPAIYAAAAERVGVAPEAIFFTDDRPENVEGAKACGWDAVVFSEAAALERQLAERGVLAAG